MSDPSTNGAGRVADLLPPQNIEAEQGCLGSMLLDNATIDDIQPFLDPGDFYRDAHEILCRSIYDTYTESGAVDSLILEDRLTREGTLARAGGLEAMLEILGSVPHAANARYYAQIVKEKAIARRVIEAGNSMVRDGYSASMTAEELIESAEREIYALGEADGRRDPTTAFEGGSSYIGMLVRYREGGVVPGIRTGFVDLDDITGGWEGNQLIVIGGRPSMGKTAFALQVATQIGEIHGIPSLYITLEMTAEELSGRLLSLRSGVDAELFRNPARLNSEHFDRLADARALIRDLPPLLIDDSEPMTMPYIASTVRRMKAKQGIGIAFVDYLQLVDAPLTRDTRQEELAKMSRRLKSLSREVEIPIVALCQLNRQVENREHSRPRMADIKESGQMEQDAHAVLLLHRPEYYNANDKPGMAEVIVAKNRNGRVDSTFLQFEKSCTRFSDLALHNGPDF
jgi:replicative DNA helicase